MRRNHLLSGMVIAMMAMLSASASAEQSADRVQIGRDIVVQSGEKAGDVVCVACSIRVHGQTTGDVVAVAGSVTLETGAQVGQGVTVVLGNASLRNNTQVAGDLVVVGGALRRDSKTMIAGSITSLEGSLWMLLILVVPLLLLGGFVTLIVWLVQRSRRPTPVPAYPARS
jgi:carbonic anhydrase/acetyltransferase-like protein (isoleucine patch superfamily)